MAIGPSSASITSFIVISAAAFFNVKPPFEPLTERQKSCLREPLKYFRKKSFGDFLNPRNLAYQKYFFVRLLSQKQQTF